MRGSGTSTLRLRLSTGSGTAHALCSVACAMRWVQDPSLDHPGVQLRTDPVVMVSSCSQCCWCGQTVTVPPPGSRCRVHEFGCPEFDFTATECALVVVAWVTDLRIRCGGAQIEGSDLTAREPMLSDRWFALLTAIADRQHQRGVFPDVAEMFGQIVEHLTGSACYD
jgi:hypothetical protein